MSRNQTAEIAGSAAAVAAAESTDHAPETKTC